MPDRIVLLPGGAIVFVELKKPKEKERKRQDYVQACIRDLGFEVFSAVDSYEKVEAVVKRCKEIVGAGSVVDSTMRAKGGAKSDGP